MVIHSVTPVYACCVQIISFECFDLEVSFLVHRYIFKVKVTEVEMNGGS